MGVYLSLSVCWLKSTRVYNRQRKTLLNTKIIYYVYIINEYLNHFSFEMLTSGSKRNLYNICE